MTKRGFRRAAVFASAAALAGAAIAGCGSQAATTSGASGSQQQSGQPPQGGGMNLTALAQALGVSAAKLQAAMQKTMPQPGQQGRPDDIAANLAEELGLSESKVQAALDKLRPQGGPPPGANQAPFSVTPSGSTTS